MFGLFALFEASSKGGGVGGISRSKQQISIIANVQFDLDTLLSTHIATIERALQLQIHSDDPSINARNLWGLLYPYSRISRKDNFYA